MHIKPIHMYNTNGLLMTCYVEVSPVCSNTNDCKYTVTVLMTTVMCDANVILMSLLLCAFVGRDGAPSWKQI